MTNHIPNTRYPELRQRAQDLLQAAQRSDQSFSQDDLVSLVNELQVHQVELELQNEELRATQLELVTSRDRYANLFHFAPVGFFTFDTQGIILEANETGARMLEQNRESLLNRPFIVYVAPESHTTFYRFLDTLALDTGGRDCDLTLRISRQDNTFQAHVHGLPVQDIEPARAFCRVAVTDITAKKKAEMALMQNKKLQGLVTFASGLAHDFNNLLAVIQLQGSLAALHLPEGHAAHTYLEKALNSTQQAANLSQQLLAYTGRTPSQTIPLNLNDMLVSKRKTLHDLLPRHITLHQRLEPFLPQVMADNYQLLQVIINLVENAVEAIGQRPGHIWLQTSLQRFSNLPIPDWTFFPTQPEPNEYVCLEVSDDGAGIPATLLEQVFDPFFTTKSIGRGLGLAVAMGIMTSHKGCIGIRSNINAGTAVRLHIPIYLSKTAAEAHPAPTKTFSQLPSVSTPVNQKTILVIDDEPALNRAITDVATHIGHRVLTASNGQEGINIFQEHAPSIDLVILDQTMPGLNGLQTFQRLRVINSAVPVILSSGYSRENLPANPIEQGFAGYLGKPYTLPQLLEIFHIYL